ncbi:MAG TPA: iron-sulfur cluster assembly scaffold protein [Thermoplasmata archaeon]|jgi:nitrogen fixation NifU-like protein
MAGGIYQAQILDHYKHPRNKGRIEPADLHATESNALCGDTVSLYVRLDGADRIRAVTFDGEGCAISQASASILTTILEGKTLVEAKALGTEDLLKVVGVPLSAVRVQCALLSFNVLRLALAEKPVPSGP